MIPRRSLLNLRCIAATPSKHRMKALIFRICKHVQSHNPSQGPLHDSKAFGAAGSAISALVPLWIFANPLYVLNRQVGEGALTEPCLHTLIKAHVLEN